MVAFVLVFAFVFIFAVVMAMSATNVKHEKKIKPPKPEKKNDNFTISELPKEKTSKFTISRKVKKDENAVVQKVFTSDSASDVGGDGIEQLQKEAEAEKRKESLKPTAMEGASENPFYASRIAKAHIDTKAYEDSVMGQEGVSSNPFVETRLQRKQMQPRVSSSMKSGFDATAKIKSYADLSSKKNLNNTQKTELSDEDKAFLDKFFADDKTGLDESRENFKDHLSFGQQLVIGDAVATPKSKQKNKKKNYWM